MGDELDEAVAALAEGGVVVFPTETVFGLGARIDRPDAIETLFELKGRDRTRPFQVLLASPDLIASVAVVDDDARALAEAFMPGPLTLVLPARAGLPSIGGDGTTVGVRVPDHDVAHALLAVSGPLVATSANRTGDPTPSEIGEVRAIFGTAVGAYLDGRVGGGPASTVVSLDGEPRVLREGAIGRDEIVAALGSGRGT